MGTMLFCYFYRIIPHIVVFRVHFRFTIGNRISSKANSSKHIPHFKYQRFVTLIFACFIFIHGDIPFFLHIPNKLLLVPLSFGQKDKASENTFMISFVFLILFRLGTFCNFLLAFTDHNGGIFIFWI